MRYLTLFMLLVISCSSEEHDSPETQPNAQGVQGDTKATPNLSSAKTSDSTSSVSGPPTLLRSDTLDVLIPKTTFKINAVWDQFSNDSSTLKTMFWAQNTLKKTQLHSKYATKILPQWSDSSRIQIIPTDLVGKDKALPDTLVLKTKSWVRFGAYTFHIKDSAEQALQLDFLIQNSVPSKITELEATIQKRLNNRLLKRTVSEGVLKANHEDSLAIAFLKNSTSLVKDSLRISCQMRKKAPQWTLQCTTPPTPKAN